MIKRIWHGYTAPERADDYEARKILKRFDERSQHYELRDTRSYT